MTDKFNPLDNKLVNKEVLLPKFNIARFNKNFNLGDEGNDTLYIEKISILKNGIWQYDTYIKRNKSISRRSVINFVKNIENEYDIISVDYEFYGSNPMGTSLYDPKEIDGYHIWIVNLRYNIDEFYKRNTTVEFEKNYDQYGGKQNKISDINNLFIFEENIDKKLDSKIFRNVTDTNTLFDGKMYYTYMTVFKDGSYLDKIKIESKNFPINWRVIFNNIQQVNSNNKFYGYVYKLSYSFNSGIILETTNDKRYNLRIV